MIPSPFRCRSWPGGLQPWRPAHPLLLPPLFYLQSNMSDQEENSSPSLASATVIETKTTDIAKEAANTKEKLLEKYASTDGDVDIESTLKLQIANKQRLLSVSKKTNAHAQSRTDHHGN